MKVLGLDGRVHPWDLTGLAVTDDRPRSAHHLRARALLARLFPCEARLEEVFLPGSGRLHLDFYLPGLRTAVEVHGEQHYGFTERFHRTRQDFLRGQDNDRRKAEWCGLNRLELRVLPYHEDDGAWTTRLTG